MSKLWNRAKWLSALLVALLINTAAQAAEHEGDSNFRDFSKMTPSGTLEFDVTSVKLIAGASWGEGTLSYQDKTHKLKITAISAGGIGYRTIKGTGEVYDLKQLSDVEGVYRGGAAGATVGTAGGGVSTIENGKGVVIRAKVTDSKGAQLSLSLGGMEISLVE